MSTGPNAPSESRSSGGGAATERLSAATDQAQEKAQDLAGQAQQQAQQVAEQAQQQAQQVAGQARNRLRDQLDERSSQAGGQISQQASDLRAVSSSLREQGKEGPAGAADKLAEYAEKVGSYLSERNADQLLHDVEDLGRRQPWTVAAGSLALGFAASRFLKASSSRRYSSRYESGTGTRPGTGLAVDPAPIPPRRPVGTMPADDIGFQDPDPTLTPLDDATAGGAVGSVPPPPRAGV